jgi:uncharacterized lipoprotein YajG
MTFRVLVVAAALLLAGCQSSPYQTGKTAADVPAKIDTVALTGITYLVNDAKPIRADDDLTGQAGEAVDSRPRREPSESERAVSGAVKAAVIDQFENFGMHVVEDDSRKPDLKVGLTLAYTPELGLLIHRSISVTLTAMTPDGQPLLSFTQAAMSSGLLGSLVVSRDDLVQSVARALIVKTVQELQRGTKTETHASRFVPVAG